MLLCEPGLRQQHKLSRFKFENAWLIDPEFKNFVNNKWTSYGNFPIVEKLELCATDMSSWSRNNVQQFTRPDGFNPGFFQKFWSTCGEELFNQCCG